LIDQDFEIQGVRFHGVEECRPCYWMNRAIAPGAEEFLKGRGGLRAKILCDGVLRSTAQLPQTKADKDLVVSPFAREREG
jgi:MOSC domain-containing protein YiiM